VWEARKSFVILGIEPKSVKGWCLRKEDGPKRRGGGGGRKGLKDQDLGEGEVIAKRELIRANTQIAPWSRGNLNKKRRKKREGEPGEKGAKTGKTNCVGPREGI